MGNGAARRDRTRARGTFDRSAEIWLAMLDAQVTEGNGTVTTADTCRQRLPRLDEHLHGTGHGDLIVHVQVVDPAQFRSPH